MNLAQLQALAVSTGFADPETAAAIAMAESGGDPAAVGDSGTSFGLWQVHTPAWPQFNAQDLLDPNYNAKAALTISQGGTVWTPWSTYNSGAYAQYMSPITRSYQAAKVIGSILVLTYVAHLVIQHGGISNSVRDLRRAVRA